MPKLLDLFCGAGGAAMGYHRAGFDEIVGVDNRPMPRYPFTLVLGDALEYVAAHGHEFDAIHASPPCQAYSTLRVMPNSRGHPDLIGVVRSLLEKTGKAFVIENVPGAPLRASVMLCGSMFGLLGLRRHRYFETSWAFSCLVPSCRHNGMTVGIFGGKARNIAKEKRHYRQDKATRGKPDGVVLPHLIGFEAMQVDWMNMDELSQAIPPAYTEFIGRQLMRVLASTRKETA